MKEIKSHQPHSEEEFLISEFKILYDRAKSYEEIKSSRVNFFLIVVAATGAIFSTLSKNNSSNQEVTIISLSLFVLLLGCFILKDLTSYSMAIITQYRRAGRVRRWFVDNNKDLSNYVAYSASDDKPSYTISFNDLHWRGAETIILFINTVSSTICIMTSLNLIIAIDFKVMIPIGLGWAVIVWFAQKVYVYLEMKKIQNSEFVLHNINFPIES